ELAAIRSVLSFPGLSLLSRRTLSRNSDVYSRLNGNRSTNLPAAFRDETSFATTGPTSHHQFPRCGPSHKKLHPQRDRWQHPRLRLDYLNVQGESAGSGHPCVLGFRASL